MNIMKTLISTLLVLFFVVSQTQAQEIKVIESCCLYTVNNINAPKAIEDFYMTLEDIALILSPTDNDLHPLGLTFSLATVSQGQHGKTSIKDNTIIYTPESNYYGSDKVEYTIIDEYGKTSMSTIHIGIKALNDPPVAGDDELILEEGLGVALLNLLDNDFDMEGDDIKITSVHNAGKGTIIERVDWHYIAPNNFNGEDYFYYTVEDEHGEKAEAMVKVIVIDRINTRNDAYEVLDNTELNVYPSLATDFIHVSYKTLSDSPVQLSVFNATGKPVYNNSGLPFVMRQEIDIELSEFPPGVYFIRIFNEDVLKTSTFQVVHR